MRILVLIPAYNEASAIQGVLQAIPAEYTCLVVDDGSTDETASHARAAGAVVLQHGINRGLGGALRTGFMYAVMNDYDAVVTLDGDGQHDPTEIPVLLEGLKKADVVIGRRSTEHMPLIRRIYNRIGTGISQILFGGAAVDTQSGFRAISRAALEKFDCRSSRMEISSELVAQAHRHHMRISEVPIHVRYTTYSMSKGQSLIEGIRTLWRLFIQSIS